MLKIVLFVVGILFVRVFEYMIFIKQVNKICHKYDWIFVNQEGNESEAARMIKNPVNYVFEEGWSAYNFTIIKNNGYGLSRFFSPQLYTIENIYGQEIANKFKQYEII